MRAINVNIKITSTGATCNAWLIVTRCKEENPGTTLISNLDMQLQLVSVQGETGFIEFWRTERGFSII